MERRPYLDPFTVFIRISVTQQIALDLLTDLIDPIPAMAEEASMPQCERIFHETKFVLLSCAHVNQAAVVHTIVDISLQEAWAKTPTGKKRETTHIVRCVTEIYSLKTG